MSSQPQPRPRCLRAARASAPETGRVRAWRPARPTRAALALIALALRPGDLRLLHCLGLVPLATYETLATLTGAGARPASATRRGWTRPSAWFACCAGACVTSTCPVGSRPRRTAATT